MSCKNASRPANINVEEPHVLVTLLQTLSIALTLSLWRVRVA
jgi:hypothetical protein